YCATWLCCLFRPCNNNYAVSNNDGEGFIHCYGSTLLPNLNKQNKIGSGEPAFIQNLQSLSPRTLLHTLKINFNISPIFYREFGRLFDIIDEYNANNAYNSQNKDIKQN